MIIDVVDKQEAVEANMPPAKHGARHQSRVQKKQQLRSSTVQSTAVVLLTQDEPLHKEKKRKVVEYVERESDRAKTEKVVIKAGDYRGAAFDLPRVDHKNSYPPNFFSNKKGWKVEYQPFLNWRGPDKKVYREVFEALQKHHAREDDGDKGLMFKLMDDAIVPGHAYSGGKELKFHALIEPILSCATSNNNQKLASAALFRNLKYEGGKVSEISPNYHRLAEMEEKELSKIIHQSGRQENNAKFIMDLFKRIRQENIQIQGLTSEKVAKIDKDAKNAADWEDGLLSLQFMVGLDMQGIFDKLVSYKGIACKTAACIMCFSFGFAVFAVDTHVFRLCQWLGWLPRNCTRDDAFKFLTIAVPPDLHFGLHQVDWHHAQNCYKCNEKTFNNREDPRWKECVCPLDAFKIDRFPNWEKPPKERADKIEQAENGDNVENADMQRPNKKLKRPEDMVTVTLRNKEEVALAREDADLEVHHITIDDAFGARPDISNFKEQKLILHITREKHDEFKKKLKNLKADGRKKITFTETVEVTTTTTQTITDTVVTTFNNNEAME